MGQDNSSLIWWQTTICGWEPWRPVLQTLKPPSHLAQAPVTKGACCTLFPMTSVAQTTRISHYVSK